MRVLVVDDDVSVCSCLAEFLRDQGFEVVEAHDGPCALAVANEQGVCLSAILADVNMPGMNGLEMWRRMEPLVSQECKVIFMSGLAQKYLQEGFTFPGEILQKPFMLSVLIEKLSTAGTVLRRQRAV